MSEYYHAGNMLLSVAGNITHEEVIDLVSQHFSNMKKSEPKTAAPTVY